jgi:hypothetical protein
MGKLAAMSEIVPTTAGTPVATPLAGYNRLHSVGFRGGWIGLFAGENQTKALERAIPEINASGRRVVAAVTDRWSFWKRLGAVLLFLVTLGFVGRVPNTVLISEPAD